MAPVDWTLSLSKGPAPEAVRRSPSTGSAPTYPSQSDGPVTERWSKHEPGQDETGRASSRTPAPPSARSYASMRTNCWIHVAPSGVPLKAVLPNPAEAVGGVNPWISGSVWITS
jgi:hypothetical protein